MAGAAVVWAFFAVTGGSRGDQPALEAERTTTSRAHGTTPSPPASTTTTTEVIDGAPLLGELVDLELVVVGGTGRVVDLDTGTVTRIRARIVGATDHGILVDDRDGVASWPPPYDGSGASRLVAAAPGTVIGEVWVVGDGTLVWVVERPDVLAQPGTATLIDLAGQVVGRIQLPESAWPIGANDRGLVAGSPGGVYVLDPAGEVERVSTGDLLGLVGDRIYVSNCDEELRCRIDVLDGGGRLIEELPPRDGYVGWGAAAPDGRLAYVVHRSHLGEPDQVAIDGVTVYEDPIQIPGPAGPGGIAWSPDGRWLAIAALDGVHFLDTLGGSGERVVDVGMLNQAGYLIFVAHDG